MYNIVILFKRNRLKTALFLRIRLFLFCYKGKKEGVHMLFCAGLFVGAMFGVGIMALLVSGKQEDQQFKRE